MPIFGALKSLFFVFFCVSECHICGIEKKKEKNQKKTKIAQRVTVAIAGVAMVYGLTKLKSTETVNDEIDETLFVNRENREYLEQLEAAKRRKDSKKR